jgi:ParB family chromosome partitioning protein
MIQNIEITKLHPHYDNPRKDLGDLSELAESIKSKGILQNLTVVPWFSKITGVGCDDPKQQEEMGYIVVIGHRRLAAAKLAGLTEVPCVVSNMNHLEQVATMLLENIQRSDLTIYEQAQGFQMMMDLGDSINNISERTGFSETTVRRRVRLIELDGEKFRKSVERGGTLMDYAELDKIHDISLRNKVLDKIGTSNFKWELQQAIDKEKSEKNMALIVAELEKFAKPIKESNGLQYVKGYSVSQKPEITVPEDASTVEYFYQTYSYGSISLYKKYAQSKPNASSVEQDNRQKEIQERRAGLEEITKRAYRLRYDFIREYPNASAKKNIGVIIEYSLRTILGDYINLDYEDFAKALDIEVNDDEELSFDNFAERITAQPERHLLIATYSALDSEREHYYSYNNQHADNETLNTVYDFLEKLGYEMSDEERKLRDGTHELFMNNDGDK